MPKELKNITDSIMAQVSVGKLKVRPRIYFVAGSILTFAGLTASVVFSIFLFGLVRFFLRSHGPMGEYRLGRLLSSFPWWSLGLAVIGLVAGLILIRRYDFSYKFNFKIVVIGFILAIIVAGWLIDVAGLNDVWLRRGPMKGLMRQYLQENNISGISKMPKRHR